MHTAQVYGFIQQRGAAEPMPVNAGALWYVGAADTACALYLGGVGYVTVMALDEIVSHPSEPVCCILCLRRTGVPLYAEPLFAGVLIVGIHVAHKELTRLDDDHRSTKAMMSGLQRRDI